MKNVLIAFAFFGVASCRPVANTHPSDSSFLNGNQAASQGPVPARRVDPNTPPDFHNNTQVRRLIMLRQAILKTLTAEDREELNDIQKQLELIETRYPDTVLRFHEEHRFYSLQQSERQKKIVGRVLHNIPEYDLVVSFYSIPDFDYHAIVKKDGHFYYLFFLKNRSLGDVSETSKEEVQKALNDRTYTYKSQILANEDGYYYTVNGDLDVDSEPRFDRL